MDPLLPGEQRRVLISCEMIQRTLCHLSLAQLAGCLISSCVYTATPDTSLTIAGIRIDLLNTGVKMPVF